MPLSKGPTRVLPLSSGGSGGPGLWARLTFDHVDTLAPAADGQRDGLLVPLTRSTTMAFCLGVTRQQMTALHSQARSTALRLLLLPHLQLPADALRPQPPSVLGASASEFYFSWTFSQEGISFCEIKEGKGLQSVWGFRSRVKHSQDFNHLRDISGPTSLVILF